MKDPNEDNALDRGAEKHVKAMIALDQSIYLGTVSKEEKARRRARSKKAKASRKANRGK